MRRLREILTINWGLKLTALLLAFLLWLAVHGEDSGERTIPVTLEIHNVPANMMITSRPTSVDVTVRGPLNNSWLWGPAPTCVIDLQSSSEEGERVIPLSPENVHLARGPGLDVLAVSPPRVRLVLERTTSKEVPIHATTEGTPEPGHEIYAVTQNPPRVILTGPKSHLERIQEVPTDPVSIRGQSETVRSFVHLNIRDTLIQSSQVRPVEVTVEIGERRRLRAIREVPVWPDDPTLVVTPGKITVELQVPLGFSGKLGPSDFQATVSARTLGPSATQGRVQPEIKPTGALAPGIAISGSVPARVTVRRGGVLR
jgi:YbbR domain-containing protein